MHVTKMLAAAAAIATTLLAGGAGAQAQDYPNKPVRIIVSFSAGGTSDVIARQVAGRLAVIWKQPVIVENRPGAGGTLGTDYVASQPADGYTLLMSSPGPIVISPMLGKKLATNPQAALAPVILIADVANVLVTAVDSRARSAADLIKDGKARPGALNFASTGVGTVAHLSGAAFSERAAIHAVHVPYKGAEAVKDVIAGRVQFMFATLPSVIGQIKGGKLQALGQVAPKRVSALPDVPTMTELGIPGMEVGSWFGIFAAKAVPQPIIDKVNASINEVLHEKDSQEALEKQGATPVGGTPQDFATLIKRDIDGWRPVVVSSGAAAN